MKKFIALFTCMSLLVNLTGGGRIGRLKCFEPMEVRAETPKSDKATAIKKTKTKVRMNNRFKSRKSKKLKVTVIKKGEERFVPFKKTMKAFGRKPKKKGNTFRGKASSPNARARFYLKKGARYIKIKGKKLPLTSKLIKYKKELYINVKDLKKLKITADYFSLNNTLVLACMVFRKGKTTVHETFAQETTRKYVKRSWFEQGYSYRYKYSNLNLKGLEVGGYFVDNHFSGRFYIYNEGFETKNFDKIVAVLKMFFPNDYMDLAKASIATCLRKVWQNTTMPFNNGRHSAGVAQKYDGRVVFTNANDETSDNIVNCTIEIPNEKYDYDLNSRYRNTVTCAMGQEDDRYGKELSREVWAEYNVDKTEEKYGTWCDHSCEKIYCYANNEREYTVRDFSERQIILDNGHKRAEICSKCFHIFSFEKIPHTRFELALKPATSNDKLNDIPDYYTFTCADCGEWYSEECFFRTFYHPYDYEVTVTGETLKDIIQREALRKKPKPFEINNEWVRDNEKTIAEINDTDVYYVMHTHGFIKEGEHVHRYRVTKWDDTPCIGAYQDVNGYYDTCIDCNQIKYSKDYESYMDTNYLVFDYFVPITGKELIEEYRREKDSCFSLIEGKYAWTNGQFNYEYLETDAIYRLAYDWQYSRTEYLKAE